MVFSVQQCSVSSCQLARVLDDLGQRRSMDTVIFHPVHDRHAEDTHELDVQLAIEKLQQYWSGQRVVVRCPSLQRVLQYAAHVERQSLDKGFVLVSSVADFVIAGIHIQIQS
jgi:hypothetical protein